MRILLAATALLASATGCISVHDRVRLKVSELTSCPPSQIQVLGDPMGMSRQIARGCDREFDCWVKGYGRVWNADCTEANASKSSMSERVVVDRLSLETDCPREQIRVTKRADWSRGDEKAFRLTACGLPYVCTTAPGRTDCEPAKQVAVPEATAAE